MLQTLDLPRDPDFRGSSSGSKSVERCEGMAEAEVAETELAEAEVAEADVAEAGFS